MANDHLKKNIYKDIFDLYKFNSKGKQEKETARKYIREKLKKEFGSRSYEDLSEIEKINFTHITIKPYFFKKFDEIKKKKISNKIDCELKEKLFELKNFLEYHNKKAEVRKKIYCETFESECNKKNAYKLFSTDIEMYYPNIECPPFETWKIGCPRIYDIIMTEYDEYQQEEFKKLNDPDFAYSYASQSEINYVILECILKKLNFKINKDKIIESLEYIKNFELGDDSIDFNMGNNLLLMYVEHKKRLEDMDFFIED